MISEVDAADAFAQTFVRFLSSAAPWRVYHLLHMLLLALYPSSGSKENRQHLPAIPSLIEVVFHLISYSLVVFFSNNRCDIRAFSAVLLPFKVRV